MLHIQRDFYGVTGVLEGHSALFFNFSLHECIFWISQDQKAAGWKFFIERAKEAACPINSA